MHKPKDRHLVGRLMLALHANSNGTEICEL
jgi:hypothetical protein